MCSVDQIVSTAITVMDVRKRPFSELEGDTADDATKRSASVNDMSNLSMGSEIAIVQPEVEAFRKEAIWRRMQEYKREAEGLGERLEQLEKSGKYHDEHIRLIDAWFSQFLEELKLPNTTQLPQLPLSQLFSGDPDSLRDHLSKFKESVLQAARSFASSPHLTLSSSEQETQNALSEVSSKVRLLQASNDVLQVEKEKRDQRLADLSFQLLALEKQEDRRKSLTLAKIAESAIQKSEGTSTADTAAQIAAPEKKHDPIDVEATKIEYETKHATLQTEIQQLTETYLQTQKELTDCRVKLEDPPLSTVERSSAYSQLNAQLSNLRPLLVKLQQANDELLQNQADSDISLTAAKIEFEKEQNFSLDQLRGQLAAAETDVTRLRSARDEIFQELQIKKTKEEKKFDTIKELADLAESRELRIKALESEIERFRPSANGTVSNDDNINLSTDELRQKFSKLEEQYKRLSAELPGVEAAFNKVHKISSAKVFDAVAFEERHTRILAEKGKADQKYFAAMKTKDMLSAEVKVLKQQISRSSEIITKLQEADNLSQKKLVRALFIAIIRGD